LTALRARSSVDVGLPGTPALARRGPNRRPQAVRDAGAPELESARLHRELIATVNHELRTPLTTVVGFSEILLAGDAGPLNELQRSMIDKMAVNGLRLLGLIEGLVSATSDCLAADQAGDLAAVMRQVLRGSSPR
jgi:signal transduction histidine kinase